MTDQPHGQPDVEIRRAHDADIDAIVAFGAAVVPAHYEPIIGREAAQAQVDQWWTHQRLQAASDGGGLFVAESSGEIVGVAELGSWDGEPVIWKLYVHPDRRSRGIGQVLLRAVVAEVPAGAQRVLLEHLAGNERAAAFYEREGFVHSRTDPSRSGDPAAATVWRARDLTGARRGR